MSNAGCISQSLTSQSDIYFLETMHTEYVDKDNLPMIKLHIDSLDNDTKDRFEIKKSVRKKRNQHSDYIWSRRMYL